MSEFARAADLETIRYGQVWEDHRILEEALQVGADDDVLCVASAGCNVLHLLLHEPRSVTAVDVSPAQLALVELKLAALRVLPHEDFVALLGYREGDRLALYDRVRPRLGEGARAFWDGHADVLERGPVQAGRLESYFRAFPGLRLVDPRLLETMLDLENLEAQRQVFDRLFGAPAFEAAFRAYYDAETMARSGRDPSQFAFVAEEDVAGFFWSRFRWVCTALPMRGNPYLEMFLTGRLRDLSRAQAYLRPDHYEKLRALAPRVSLEQAEIGALLSSRAPGAFSKAALSDVFEYMAPEASDALFATLGERLRAGGRVAYWNLLVPRASPRGARARLEPLTELSHALWQRDRSWFYRAFHVETIR